MGVSTHFDLPFRIIVRAPPGGVAFAVQSGRTGRAALIRPTRATSEVVVFNLSVRAEIPPGAGKLRLSSPIVQGRPGSRFVYVNAGTLAGQAESAWTRRAKVPLAGLTRALVDEARTGGGVVQVEIDGQAADGGPASGTVLLRGGWQIGRR